MQVELTKIDEVWSRVVGDYDAVELLAEHFTFEVPGGNFSPKHVNNGGTWDGHIRLLNRMTGKIYTGLIPATVVKCKELLIDCIIDSEFRPDTHDYTLDVEQFIETLDLPFEPYDFQMETLQLGLQRKRMLVISPTSSGKSLIIYLIAKYLNKKTLIISPRKGLILQLKKDMIEYGCEDEIHTIMAGSDKSSPHLINISTWHSLAKLPKKYFDQYDVVIGDEVHLFEAKSLVGIMERTNSIQYRIGFTGSLKESKTNELVLTGLFGGIHTTITTREMIDRGISSDADIYVLVFVHDEVTQKQLPARHSFRQEDDLIIQHPKRNKYIAKLVESLTGNTLVVFRKIEKHGDILNKLLVDIGKKIHYIHGKTKVDERERIRQHMETVDGEVLEASSGTSSTGISIKNIQNMVQTNGIRSRVDLLQTFGRGLRKDGKTNRVKYFDLADKLTRTGDKKQPHGYSYRHLLERLQMYTEMEIPYKLIEIPL